MHAIRLRARYTPTSVGALMDPGFLRKAVNDMIATTDEEEHEEPAPPWWRRWSRTVVRLVGDVERIARD